uniref:Reverse transcriptase/retrotransposon-derived protein RNase H-like domain-containing protein n=1 Tax=Tanacetum cinerariifolium TaxID=118510 RepID=A0A699JQS9_TANCI|nr:hypothetical protein [Tanacetum cinerariifolium]
MLKFPVDGGIVTICSTILMPAECTTVITSSAVPKEVGARPENFKVALHPDFPDQEVAIGGTLSAKGLCSIMKKNLDIFAWQPSDMTGVWRSVAEHRLNIWEDCYPLTEIDWKVEFLCGYPFNCFLDAYKGYHQIQLAESDEEKTAFHTGQGVYCYTKMPFGLKNAGATYQRLVNKAFDSQIEAEQAFKQLKQHLSELPLVVAPKPKEELIVYLSATYGAISAVLMTERGAIQTPVYFISRALQGLELNYTLMEKLILSLVFAAKRLRRTSVKGQVLADFLTEMPDENPPATPVAETQQETWTLFTDGSSSSNNEAEYEALIAGLRIATRMGVQNVHAEYVIKEIHEGSCSMHAGPWSVVAKAIRL